MPNLSPHSQGETENEDGSSQFFMAVNIQVVVFRAMNMLLFDHVDGDSLFLRIVGIHLQDTTQKKTQSLSDF
jgi:hypothetical protein